MNTSYEKLRISLRYFLLGKEYYKAADALEFAGSYHTGLRKDGVTPELQHQIEITHYLRTLLPSLLYPEETLTAALLHDVTEDYGVLTSTIAERYGNDIAVAVNLLDKNGKDTNTYFDGLANNPIASIVKGGDRIHNIQSMVGVFSVEKQLKYAIEVRDHFLPMLKIARRKFVRQENAYENIKHVLSSQLELLIAGPLADISYEK
jgi:(p)ppGpp synthase/HD superfamily hydrolase